MASGSFIVGSTCFMVVLKFILNSRCFRSRNAGIESRWWFKPVLLLCSVGPVILTLVSSIIVYFLWIFPQYHGLIQVKGVITAVLCCYIWLNITFNYFAVMFTSAGKAFTVNELETEGYSTSKVDLCQKCHRLKCRGTHHCSTCRCCIRLMSHHCEAANNCVGLNNFSYYFIFLAYSVLGEVFMIHQLYKPFFNCYVDKSEYREVEKCQKLGDLPLLFVVFASQLILSLFWLSFHTLLLIMDLSGKELRAKYLRSLSCCRFVIWFCKRLFKRRVHRHRINHLLWERKPYWINYVTPSLSEPPIDLAAEDLINYDEEESYMV